MAATPLNIPELVGRMPQTDQEIEALKPPPPDTQNPPAKPKPKRDRLAGSKFTAPDPDVVEKICAEILAGGPAGLIELIGLIRDPASDDFKDYKAEYLCHCLTIYLGRSGREAQRRFYIDTLTGQVGQAGLPLHARRFLVRELQFIGDRRCASVVGALLADEQLCDDAARTLLAIQDGAAAQFRSALPKAAGRSRLVVLQGLAVLRDPASSEALQTAAADPDREIRLTGLWGLARIGSPKSAGLLLKGADTAEAWERIKATQACLLLAETLAATNRKTEAVEIYTHLHRTRTEPKEQYVREAAARALESLGSKVT